MEKSSRRPNPLLRNRRAAPQPNQLQRVSPRRRRPTRPSRRIGLWPWRTLPPRHRRSPRSRISPNIQRSTEKPSSYYRARAKALRPLALLAPSQRSLRNLPLLLIFAGLRGAGRSRPLALLAALPSARSAIHPFSYISGPRGRASLSPTCQPRFALLAPSQGSLRNSPPSCHPERSRGSAVSSPSRSRSFGCPILDEVKGGIPLLMSPLLSVQYRRCRSAPQPRMAAKSSSPASCACWGEKRICLDGKSRGQHRSTPREGIGLIRLGRRGIHGRGLRFEFNLKRSRRLPGRSGLIGYAIGAA